MIRFTVDPGNRRRTAVFTGVINEPDLLASYAALLADPAYEPNFDDLVDLRGVERLELSAATIRELTMMFVPIDEVSGPTRTAIVAASDAVFGMSRMYEMLRGDNVPEEIRVFRSFEDAVAWLGRQGSPG